MHQGQCYGAKKIVMINLKIEVSYKSLGSGINELIVRFLHAECRSAHESEARSVTAWDGILILFAEIVARCDFGNRD